MFSHRFLKDIIMPLADKAMGTSLTKYWKEIPKMNTWSSDEIVRWQDDKFRSLVKEAYENTVYYRRVMDEIGIVPSDIKGTSDIKLFPVLTKPMIRNHYNELKSKRAREIRHKNCATGGSTGDPMQYLQTNEAWSFANANEILYRERTGFFFGMPFMALGSSSIHVGKTPSIKHRIYYGLKNKHSFSGINMTDVVMDGYLEYIKRERINFIYGYASSIYLLAKRAGEVGYPSEIKCCYPTSEVLRDEFYSSIKDAFGCQILDSYGAQDGGITAFSMDQSEFEIGYNSYVTLGKEVADNTRPACITDLLNNVFPFINYQIGDLFEAGQRNSTYNGQTVNRILGRTSELIEMDNGARLTGLGFATLFKDMPIEYFCIEKASGRKLVCHLIPEQGFSAEHSKYIIKCIQNQFGTDVSVSVDFIQDPILSKSGKRVYIIDGEKEDKAIQ